MEDIVIEEMNYKSFAILLGNLFLLIAAGAAAVYGFGKHRAAYWLPGTMFGCLLLVSFIACIVKAAQVRKLITITMDGIVDQSTNGGVGFISFDDIKEFLVVTIYNKKAIAVIPKNIDSFLSKFNVMRRRQIKRNLKLNLPPVIIFVDLAKDMDPEDILSLLHKRLADYSSLYE